MQNKNKTESVVKKSHIGILGSLALTFVSQFLSAQQSTKDIKNELDKVRSQYTLSQVNAEKFFVRKDEFHRVTSRLEKMGVELAKMNEQIQSLRSQTYSFMLPSRTNVHYLLVPDFKMKKFPGGI